MKSIRLVNLETGEFSEHEKIHSAFAINSAACEFTSPAGKCISRITNLNNNGILPLSVLICTYAHIISALHMKKKSVLFYLNN